MLSPYLERVNKYHIVLGSASKARKQILEIAGLKVEVFPSTFEENLDKKLFEDSTGYVVKTSEHKMLDCLRMLKEQNKKVDILICADTIIEKDGIIYEKPIDNEDAFKMLSLFAGKTHNCYTSVWVAFVSPEYEIVKQRNFVELTEVTFSKLDDSMIWGYVKSGETFGKAGGYGIQDQGATFIEIIKGDFYNVWGFPMNSFCKVFISMLEEEKNK